MKYTPKTIAAVLGCTVKQARDGMLKCAKSIRAFTPTDLRRWQKTRAQAEAIAADYEQRATS